jgi:ATP-dependent Clp protease ATP-binding subunit ClpC
MSLIDLLKKFRPAHESLDVSNFTPRAQQALVLAHREAIRLHHDFVGSEHVLLSLIKLGKGVAFNVLGNLGLNLENVRAEVEKLVGAGTNEKMVDNPLYSPQTKRIVQMAKDEAKALHHIYICTEHLLLGLLRDEGGSAAVIFKNFQLDVEQVRKEILKELNPFIDDAQKG